MLPKEVRLYFAYMSHLFFYIIFGFAILFYLPASSQKKWDGGGNDGQWNNALNWDGDVAPVGTDMVILDNSVVQENYTVTLPGGTRSVTVKQVSISPSSSHHIELVLPVENTQVPGFVISGPGYGLDIGAGGVFRNASGAISGTPVIISDSIRIRNGGRYVHNSQRAHAANVQVLSSAPGTEKGIIEFDVPDVSSTISLSGRTFGKLLLRAAAVPGSMLKYTAAGTMGVRIRSDFEIGPGVTCGLNFSDTIKINGDFIDSGTVDMGNTARNVVLAVNGNMLQSPSGVISESGTGMQEIVLQGTLTQQISVRGVISNEVAFTVNNPAGVSLQWPLTLPFALSLRRGILTTSSSALLSLGASCSLNADSSSDASFINGPVQKKGLSGQDFIFPVGKGTSQRWLQLKNASGDFIAEYFQKDPAALSNNKDNSLHHISQLEYWNILGAGSATIKLSFTDPGSGGVTSLADLRVARLINGTWDNEGNTSVGGSAGADGWVSSAADRRFSAGNNYLALASASGQENPLPFSKILLRGERVGNAVRFSWNILSDRRFERLEIQVKQGDADFETVYGIESAENYFNYYLQDDIISLVRIKAVGDDGRVVCYSNVVPFKKDTDSKYVISGTAVTDTYLPLTVTAPVRGRMELAMYTNSGIRVKTLAVETTNGAIAMSLDVASLKAGMYYLIGTVKGQRTNLFRFVKR